LEIRTLLFILEKDPFIQSSGSTITLRGRMMLVFVFTTLSLNKSLHISRTMSLNLHELIYSVVIYVGKRMERKTHCCLSDGLIA
jgi:hypothetical protein